ncbi:MAG: hypothetical protein U9P10_00640 [Thermodesulfobacteriota bacterium]|nr:hypothetical protein [Thermodesulfobacteriota bacterium]
MGRFEEFELQIRKINTYPLIYEAVIPEECSFFQDVRRYHSATAHLEVQIVDIKGLIHLEQDMYQIPISKLTSAQKKEFIEYLKIRVARGDNVGSSWAFFKSPDPKRITAFGANVVFKDAKKGHERAKQLLMELQKNLTSTRFFLKLLTLFLILTFAGIGGYFGYKKIFMEKENLLNRFISTADSPEMKFYKSVFPDLYSWKKDGEPFKQSLGETLLNPEYIRDILKGMEKDFYKDKNSDTGYRTARTLLFLYFNYNERVKNTIRSNRTKLAGTEFYRLFQIYSCEKSGFNSNIFYFKVGDLPVNSREIVQYFKDNHISFRDYERIRDSEEFSKMLKSDMIHLKLKKYLKNIYTSTPLKIQKAVKDINWYIVVKKDSHEKIKFAAFFNSSSPTLVPQDIGTALLTAGENNLFTWYTVTSDQAEKLRLDNESTLYFTEKMGQALKLELLAEKIKTLGLEKISLPFPVSVHRELLMEDSNGKYGMQCYDPVTSLVISNFINSASFERSKHISIKRDPIEVNTALIQLSKEISQSTQAINIVPGKTGLIELFKNKDSFRAILFNGNIVTFEKAAINLFNPFSFIVHSDSITFNFKNELAGCTFTLEDQSLKIIKSDEGGYEITIDR